MPDPHAASSITDWLTFAIATAALLQPWVVWAWKRFVLKGRVEVHESGSIEIGLGNWGHSVALIGTLRAVHQEVWIKRIRLEVTRERDKAQMQLAWRAFRETTFTLDPMESKTVEAASSFLLSPVSPFKYNIFFGEDAFVAEHRSSILKLRDEWQKYITKSIPPDLRARMTDVLADPTIATQLSDEFLEQEHATKVWSSLNEAFYWSTGTYGLQLSVECAAPKRDFVKLWRFNLEHRDSEILRLNCIGLLQQLTGQRPVSFHAYPEYTNLVM